MAHSKIPAHLIPSTTQYPNLTPTQIYEAHGLFDVTGKQSCVWDPKSKLARVVKSNGEVGVCNHQDGASAPSGEEQACAENATQATCQAGPDCIWTATQSCPSQSTSVDKAKIIELAKSTARTMRKAFVCDQYTDITKCAKSSQDTFVGGLCIADNCLCMMNCIVPG